MTRATMKRLPEPTTNPRPTPKPPRIRPAPQVKPHKVPVTVKKTTRAIPGSSRKQVVLRVAMDLPRAPQVKAHPSPIRMGKTKARPNHPSHPIVIGLAIPDVPQVKPHSTSKGAS